MSVGTSVGGRRIWTGGLRVVLLMLSDLFCLAATWAFVVWAYRALGFGHYKYGAEFYLRLWPMAIAYLALNSMFRLYHGSIFHPAAPLNPIEELRRLVGSSILVHIGVIAYLALAYQTTENYSRAVIVMSGILVALLAQPLRDLVRSVAFRFNGARIPVVLSGEGEIVRRLEQAISLDSYLGFRVMERTGTDVKDIVAAAERSGVRILVTCQDARLFRCNVADLAANFAHIEYMPGGSSFPVDGGHTVMFDGIGGVEMVNQRHFRVLRLEKHVLDKAFAVFAFILLSPFFVVIPVLVKLTSRGPVFYRQNRLGKRGRPIRVWKFRSMYVDADARLKAILESDPARKAEWEANFKLADDPRVTPLGKFLRKTSIDEFPQLFNVFAGDMALVGPRPIVEGEVSHYGSSYDTFASVKPGITGLSQASGRSDTDYARRVALDVHYVLNWSPWMDIWILFRTISAVLFMRGAR